MAASSTLDPDAGDASGTIRPPGHDTGALGPSDLSDTGSDSVGPQGYDASILEADGDSVGTGVDPAPYERNRDEDGADIGFDRIVGAGEAGLGGGLDQAEEGRYGVTDEELDPVDEAGAALDPIGQADASDDEAVPSSRPGDDALLDAGDDGTDGDPDEDDAA